MKKHKLTLLLILLTIGFGWAQNIEVKSSFTSYKFIDKGERISRKDLLKKMESHKEAFNLLKKANTDNNLLYNDINCWGIFNWHSTR